MEPSPPPAEPPLAPRDPRVRLAAERTLLAWIRTGLALMGFGFVVARFGLFLQELALAERQPANWSTGYSRYLGIGLVSLGIAVSLVASLEYRTFIKRYERGLPDQLPHWSMGLISALIIAGLGSGMVCYLLFL